MSSAMFRHHPYRIPIIGWESEMRGLTTADALSFYKRHYAPNNAILVVAGDVSLDELKRLAEKHYGDIPRGADAVRERVEEPPQVAARRVALDSPQVREPSLRRSYLAPSHNAGETRRSEERRVGKAGVGTGRSWWSPTHSHKKNTRQTESRTN